MRFRKIHRMARPYPIYAKYGAVDTRVLNINFGDPTVILFKKLKTAYIIYSPLATETAQRLLQLLYEQGYDVTMVNGASDSETANKLKRWAIKTYSHLCSISWR
jgi:hypothetical protein